MLAIGQHISIKRQKSKNHFLIIHMLYCSCVGHVYNMDELPCSYFPFDSNAVSEVSYFIRQTIFCINFRVAKIWIAIFVIVLCMEFISNLSIEIKRHIRAPQASTQTRSQKIGNKNDKIKCTIGARHDGKISSATVQVGICKMSCRCTECIYINSW